MTKYDLFRRRIAPVAFLLAFGWIAYDTCDKAERTHAMVVLDFGAYAHDVRNVEAEIWIRDAQVAQFRRTASEGAYIGPVKLDVSLPDTKSELRIDVDLGKAGSKHIVRRLEIQEGATVEVRLEHELR